MEESPYALILIHLDLGILFFLRVATLSANALRQ